MEKNHYVKCSLDNPGVRQNKNKMHELMTNEDKLVTYLSNQYEARKRKNAENPELYKLNNRIDYLTKKLRYIKNPELLARKYSQDKEWRLKNQLHHKIVRPTKLYIKESDLN
jgi:hypothetical protein